MTSKTIARIATCVLAAAALACGSSEKKADEKPTQATTASAPAKEEPYLPPPTVDESLIPREALFGNPERTMLRIRPDGKMLSFLAPKNGVLNVFVAEPGKLDEARAVTDDKLRGIRFYTWAADGKHLLFLQDKGGDENWHVYATDVKTNKTRDLTPLEGVNARITHVSPKKKAQITVAINDRDKRFHDLYVVDLKSAKRTLLEKNEQGFLGYLVNDDLKAPLALRPLPTGGMEVLKRKGDKWEKLVEVDAEDMLTTSPAGFDGSGKKVYMVSSKGRNTAALFEVALKDGKEKLLAESDKADINDLVIHPKTKKVEAAGFNYDRQTWVWLDKLVEGHFAELGKLGEGDWEIVDRTFDGDTWVVAQAVDNGPVTYWLYDAKKKKAEKQFVDRPALSELELAPMHPKILEARDGRKLVSYLTLPVAKDQDADGLPDHPLSTVLFVHGGPWSRDSWGFNARHQWLANRGYAVLSVNYRGSTGFGKDHINAADGEWAGKMHDDLIDAVKWAIEQGIADEEKIAIMGGSYGGYATLVGLTSTPERFACGVDVVGPSNLVTLLTNIPPYWAPMFPMLKQKVGDPGSADGRAALMERSPLSKADRIQRPLLIAQGANDPRVKQQESDQIVDAMQDKGIPVTYVLFPDEGHGFARPPNRMSFYGVSETFLAQCLGGKALPLELHAGTTMTVPEGAGIVHGLETALKESGERAADAGEAQADDAAEGEGGAPTPPPAKKAEG